MDALSLEEIGYPAMATFGLQLPKWINRLTWWRRIAIATDADGPGDAAASRWGQTVLSRGTQRLRPQRGKDFNDWLTTDPEGMRRYLEQEVFRHNYPRNCPFGMIIPSRREEWGGLATEIEVERGG
jgi:DNA primase